MGPALLSRRRLILAGAASAVAWPLAAQDAGQLASVVGPEPRPDDLDTGVPEPYVVDLAPGIPAGELHVVPDLFALYWTLPNSQALRYACGIGRDGLYEPGAFYVGEKKEWPSWTPTPDMIERDPEQYAQYADGMPGGPDNPLGARAIYLFDTERGDTFLRIHGTNAPETIGTAVSNGCARLTNDQIVDLYARVPINALVFLHPPGALGATG